MIRRTQVNSSIPTHLFVKKKVHNWLASAKLRSLVEVILARPIRGQDFKFSFNVIFLSTTDVNYVGDEVDPRPALQEVDQHV